MTHQMSYCSSAITNSRHLAVFAAPRKGSGYFLANGKRFLRMHYQPNQMYKKINISLKIVLIIKIYLFGRSKTQFFFFFCYSAHIDIRRCVGICKKKPNVNTEFFFWTVVKWRLNLVYGVIIY